MDAKTVEETDMRVKRNDVLLHASHLGLLHLLKGSIELSQEADWVFWSNVWLMVNQSAMNGKEKCFKEIVQTITKQEHYPIDNRELDYQQAGFIYEKSKGNYHFSGNVPALGYSWRSMIEARSTWQLDCVWEWIKAFRDTVMPGVNEIIEAYEAKEPQLTDKELKARIRKYNAHRKTLTDCQKLLEKSMDLFDFMELDPRLNP